MCLLTLLELANRRPSEHGPLEILLDRDPLGRPVIKPRRMPTAKPQAPRATTTIPRTLSSANEDAGFKSGFQTGPSTRQ